MYETINTNAFIEITPSSCAPNETSGFVIGTASVPQIPANKCAGTAPTTSSIFIENKSLVPKTTITPPTAPINIAAIGDGIKGSAVIATNPPIHPLSIWITSVLPNPNLVVKAAAITPPAPAKNVFINIVDTAIASTAVPIASCEPPLKPNQPNHKINIPIVTNGIDEAAKGFNGAGEPDFVNLPNLGPKIIAPANAAAPPVE